VATASVSGNHARLSSGSDYWGKMHDPFDSRFARSVRGGLRGVVPLVKGDPWCVGYFVDNELSWGGFGDEGGRYGLALGALGSPADSSPAKRAFLDRLKKKYGEVERLNAAWKTNQSDWQALEASWKPTARRAEWSDEFKADLTGFVKELARTYFKTIRDQLKAADPDHLYLGCRFAWRTEEAVAAAAEFCDVVSFNIYDRRVDPAKWGFLTSLGRPAIIGEFHVGALDRGMFHPGLVSARDQQERAAIFTDYVTSVLDNPALVGCHWFQYVDEPLTGRSFDGENYNIGFLTVTDTPYPEMVAAALLHDLGDGRVAEVEHAAWGAELVRPLLGERVAWLIATHAEAKRYLCTTRPDYWALLSPVSQETLRNQGGLMSPEEVRAFAVHPWVDDAVWLRLCDDGGKDPSLPEPDTAPLREALERVAAQVRQQGRETS
jgi:predicted HD phosphohydrolase